MLLEIIVQSLADARAATAGGADRLEVVRDIDREGLTPDAELVQAIASETGLPLRVMVRESDGFTIADPGELAVLQRAFATFGSMNVDGAVLGYARDGKLDFDTMEAILSVAPGLRATLHRAFDAASDPLATIDSLRAMPQIDRVLTTGGTGDWVARCRELARYAARAAGRVAILAGGGVDEHALRALAATGCVREAHVGRAACEPPARGAPVSADRVTRLKAIASAR